MSLTKEAIDALRESTAIELAWSTIDMAMKDGDAIAALPKTFDLHDLQKYMPFRRRLSGTYNTNVLREFAAYTSDNKEEGARIFVDPDNMAAVAVLNFGTPSKPGHGDALAKFDARQTAAYKALQRHAETPLGQQKVAEFFEDWASAFSFKSADGSNIAHAHAVDAVRKITIDALRKMGSEVAQLSATKTVFETVAASSSAGAIPAEVCFRCEPYVGFDSRTFALRLSIITTADKPALTLRVINAERHIEEMALELADKVRGEGIPGVPVLIGAYTKA